MLLESRCPLHPLTIILSFSPAPIFFCYSQARKLQTVRIFGVVKSQWLKVVLFFMRLLFNIILPVRVLILDR